MRITKEQLAGDLGKSAGFYKSNIRKTLNCLEDVLKEYFLEVSEEEEVVIQITDGIRIGCKLMPERERVDPRTLEPITCSPTVKPFAKFSDKFREDIQNNYEEESREE